MPSPLTDVEGRRGGSDIRECREICIHPSMATMMLGYHFVPFPWLFTLRLSFLSVCLSVYPKTHVPLHAMLCCSSLRLFLFLFFPLSSHRKRILPNPMHCSWNSFTCLLIHVFEL